MQFCGKYGYDYGFEGSDNEEIEDEEIVDKTKSKKKIRRVDCNIISIKFDHLTLTNETFPGEPIKCSKCEAIMTLISRSNLKTEEDNKKIWTCEFCFEKNDLTSRLSTLDEIPQVDDLTYLIEPAPIKSDSINQENKAPSEAIDNSYLSFCIDISGSMDTRIGVNSNAQVPSRDSAMTRLQGVKCACLKNLDILKTNMPNKKVNLVTFSSDIKYYADGSKPVVRINDENSSNIFANAMLPVNTNSVMQDRQKMLDFAFNQDSDLKNISESSKFIEGHIKNLRTEGCTALGPALVFSIGFCSKKPGSQILLCTDGCANVGMGNLESNDNPNSEAFYEDLADYAKEKSVSVNVITMEGTDCKLSLLGKVADKTNGTIEIVNPLDLGDLMASILGNQIIATNVKAKLIVNNKYLYIRTEELEREENKAIETDNLQAKEALNLSKRSMVIKEIGNATNETEITFEYGVRKIKDKAEKKAFQELPFQLQIYYTAPDGSKAIKVITKTQIFTKDRAEAERNITHKSILWTNADQKMSSYVIASDVNSAKYKQKQQMNFASNSNMKVPAAYAAKSRLVADLKKDTKYNFLSDVTSKEMYKGKKVSSKAYKEEESGDEEEE